MAPAAHSAAPAYIILVEDTLTKSEAEFYLRARAAATSKARELLMEQRAACAGKFNVDQAEALKNVMSAPWAVWAFWRGGSMIIAHVPVYLSVVSLTVSKEPSTMTLS